MVSFHDNPEQYKSAAMLLQLDQEVRCQDIGLLFLLYTIKQTLLKHILNMCKPHIDCIF